MSTDSLTPPPTHDMETEDGRSFKVVRKSSAGRKTKLTPELIEKICALVRTNNYIETAAAYNNVSKETLYAWLRRGQRQRHSIYGEFSDAVGKALAQGEIFDVSRITSAALTGNWKAAAWRLERKFRERWGPPAMETPTPAGSTQQAQGDVVVVVTGDSATYIQRLREARAMLVNQTPLPLPTEVLVGGNGGGNGAAH